MKKMIKFESEVLEIRQLTKDIVNVTFSVPTDFTFKAGQFVSIILEQEGKEIRRPYSIASSPLIRGTIDLMVKKKEGGTVSVYLTKLKKGDKVKFFGPMGHFTIKDSDREAAFIATGVGVAPFRAMIYTLLENGTRKRIFLFLSVKYEDDLVYEDEWQGLEQKYPHFKHFVSVTRPSEKFKGNKGRVHTLLDEFLPADFKGDFYLCGINVMVEECEDNLAVRGISKERVFFEKYG